MVLLLDIVLVLVFLGLTLATPAPHPHDPAATIIPGRIRPNFHDPADGLSGIQVAGIVVCSLVGLFILGFLALVTWDSYRDHQCRQRRGTLDAMDELGFPGDYPHVRISSTPFSPASDKFSHLI